MRRTRGLEALVADGVPRQRLLEPDDVRNRDLVGAAEPILDRLVQEEACDRECDQRSEPDEPRPDGPTPLAGRIEGRGIAGPSAAGDLRRACRVDDAASGEDDGRGLRGLERDVATVGDGLEIRIHGGGGLVAVGRLLGERAQDDVVEVVGNLRPKLGRRVGISERCFMAISTGVSPENGTSAVRSS